jgi:hypothetical protein
VASVTLYETRPVRTARIEREDYLNTSFKTGKRISLIEETLPFRVKFTAIMVPGYGPNNVPAIPLQVIGYSNYIL